MARTFSTGVEVPTAGDRHPSEAWWGRIGATTNAAILNETGKARADSAAAVDALRQTVTQDYLDRATATQYGIPGPASKISIGNVQGGATAAASMTGDAPAQTLNLTLPQGPRGPEGPGGAFQMVETTEPGLFEVGDTLVDGYVDAAGVRELIDESSVFRGVLPDYTDVNTVRVPGIYSVATAASAATMTNLPSKRPGILKVESNTGAAITVQYYRAFLTVNDPTIRFVRSTLSTGNASWAVWTDESRGTGSTTTITSSSAFVGSNDRLYAVVAGVMRNPGAGWETLDDDIHRHANVEQTLTDSQVITVQYPGILARKVVSWVCTPDEQLTKAGYACAASVSLSEAKITIARQIPLSDYVQFHATNGWTSLNGVFKNLVFSGGTLTMNHDPVGGENVMDFQVTGRGETLVSSSVQAGGSTQTTTKIDFRDYNGNLVTTANTGMKAYVSRGSMGTVDPTTLTTSRYPASNIWFHGVFEIG